MPKSKHLLHRAVGRVYNLRKIYKRLNGVYFGGEVKARVEWGRARGQKARRSREFGSYYYKERLIRVHPVLDQAWVPLHVIESVLYHEMCHQICPTEIIKGRRHSHTKDFRRREREYVHYQGAENWMQANLQQLMRAAPALEMVTERKATEQLKLGFAA